MAQPKTHSRKKWTISAAAARPLAARTECGDRSRSVAAFFIAAASLALTVPRINSNCTGFKPMLRPVDRRIRGIPSSHCISAAVSASVRFRRKSRPRRTASWR